MSTDVVATEDGQLVDGQEIQQFVTMRLDGQLFGLPVLSVQDVLREQAIARIPLAPAEVAGAINLRGRIVTVINMRTKLAIDANTSPKHMMQVVVEYQGEPYSLIVDSVGDVLNLPQSDFEPTPANLSQNWGDISSGVFRLNEEIMVVLNIATLLTLPSEDEIALEEEEEA
jgi:purine-binding chemotaxis protein CheW